VQTFGRWGGTAFTGPFPGLPPGNRHDVRARGVTVYGTASLFSFSMHIVAVTLPGPDLQGIEACGGGTGVNWLVSYGRMAFGRPSAAFGQPATAMRPEGAQVCPSGADITRGSAQRRGDTAIS